jgi:transcriptional regulator with XRE-family HTH domain
MKSAERHQFVKGAKAKASKEKSPLNVDDGVYVKKSANPEQVLMTLGDRLRMIRTMTGLSQHQLAEQAEVSHPYLMMVENGGANVSVLFLDRLAKALGVSVAAFFLADGAAIEDLDSVYAKMTSELTRVAKAMDHRRDAIGTILDQLERKMNKAAAVKKKST